MPKMKAHKCGMKKKEYNQVAITACDANCVQSGHNLIFTYQWQQVVAKRQDKKKHTKQSGVSPPTF